MNVELCICDRMRIGNTIYLDHHATTPVDSRVSDKMLPYFGGAFGNPHSADHAMGWAAAQATDAAAAQVGKLMQADAEEIVFTSGATEANNLALLGLIDSGLAQKRRRVLLSAIDHKSALAVGRAIQQRGFNVAHLPVQPDGHLDLETLRKKLDSDVLLISFSLVNSEIGTIQKVEEIACLARQHGVLMHWDAAQAPCAFDMTLIATSADMVSLSAHKIYGPKGIGALYIKHDVQRFLRPIIHGGGQQRNLRSGTLPTALCVGFGAAAEILVQADAIEERERVRGLRDLFVKLLRESDLRILINGPDEASRHPGNANIRFIGMPADDLLATLQPRLAASAGSACSSGIPEPSHVLRGIGLSAIEVGSSIRFCVGRYTTDEDIHEAARLVTETAKTMGAAGLQVA
jgi:cysteine desulfurase